MTPTEPTEEMLEAACSAYAATRGKRWPDDYTKAGARSRIRHRQREALEAALNAATDGDQLPPYHPGTCGTGYLTFERSLRIIEQLQGRIDAEAIDAITRLCDEAGVPFARIALRRQETAAEGRMMPPDFDIPF
jgi:hypothetical protein